MKKLNALLFILIIAGFTGCKKEDTPKKSNTFIHITTKYDSEIKGPEGRILLFDLTDNKVTNYNVISAGGIYAISDVNDEYVFPIYNEKITPSKDLKTGLYINESFHSIFSSDLYCSFPHDFLVVIDLDSAPYSYTYKKVSWGVDNIELNKVFKSISTDIGRHFEQW